MPKYTGSLNTFGLRPFTGRFPEINMIPSNAATVGQYIYPIDPVPVVFLTSDAFEVTLAAVEVVAPEGTYFSMEVTWFNDDERKIPIGYDRPPWKFYTTVAGGDLATMIDRPILPGEWWVTTSPGVPPLARVGDFILNPTTGQYDQIQES